MNVALRFAAIVSFAGLAGCTMGPDFVKPIVPEPEQYRVDVPAGESIANVAWFELFDDEQLNQLIVVALEENKDLLTAIARIEEARASLGFVRADQFPSIGGEASGSRGNLLGGFSNFGTSEQFVLGAGLDFEIDLWGKLRRSTESARAELLSTVEARNIVLTTLISDVAATYLLLLDVDSRLDISEQTLITRKESTRIIQARFDKGTVPLLDLNQAQIEEADAAASLVALRREQRQVENQLKRRYDLIPNLVETVKGYAKHEKELFENIAQARTQYFQAKDVKGKVDASNRLEGALSRLLLLKETYPVLKANESFLKLQDSLEGTENRIAVERKRYNDSVQLLNTYIRTFMGRFYSAFANVSKAEYYEIPDAEKAAPKVTF